ncbi:ATP-binding cassette domain-containing protein [Mesorhizobium sp. VK23B]|uniref:ATP-binding cassette domain-containing protein n=1 Tax=Mesorhizobium dulcispinae TaxID=3072316 RepID=A0ABU4X8F4_9HYPH|nr:MULTISPECIES: ATP-binding cassette domain-containing protein [unclassified Mesorhizobium]MDX8464691.1 ATP-binding cassette domain-containing protein [Mesorhizobium sp. VK23B]MDX8471077.1 ATP-binding cassette domain-containing protein [Mesorhizobium sp. VK23A]
MSLSEKLHRSAGLVFPALATLAALAAAAVIDPYLAYVATSWVIFGLLGLSLDLVWGRGGLLSLGQTAFYGLGGYFGSVVAINMVTLTGNSLIWSLPAGAAFGALSAALLGWIIFFARMGPLQATILSYTFTLLLWSVSQSFSMNVGDAAIGGDNGLSGIPGVVVGFGTAAEALGPTEVFVVAVLIAAAAYFLCSWLMRGTFGRVIDCIRIDAQKTELLGYDVRRYQLANFAVAGAVAGLAGALFGAWANYINPTIFSVQEAMLVPIYVLVGGLGTLAGAFVGAIVIGALSFYLGGGAVGGQTTLILGVVLILLVLFLRNGLLGALDALWRRTLPDHNAAARETGSVAIDPTVLEGILVEATGRAGPAKSLATSDLYKRFGGVIPVDKVTREFNPGRPYSLIGPNGAGKSSYLKACAGIYQPEAGSVLIGGTDVTGAAVVERARQGMGVKNQKPQVFGELTVLDNLWMAAFSRTRDKAAAAAISHKILSMLGMERQAAVQASALSHGQQQWLDIGMVLCLAPRVVLLDEPAAGMTNEETCELSVLVRTLARHATAIVVEHDMEFVRTLEGHVTVLHQGKVFAEGDIAALRGDDRVLDIYLGRREHV